MKRLVELSKIFSDANRAKIISLVLRDKEVCVCEICDTLELSQPLVSRHLKKMKESGLLDSKKEGKWVVYTLKPEHQAQCFLNALSQDLDKLPKLVSCNFK